MACRQCTRPSPARVAISRIEKAWLREANRHIISELRSHVTKFLGYSEEYVARYVCLCVAKRRLCNYRKKCNMKVWHIQRAALPRS